MELITLIFSLDAPEVDEHSADIQRSSLEYEYGPFFPDDFPILLCSPECNALYIQFVTTFLYPSSFS